MKTAVVLHVFFEDIAFEILHLLSQLEVEFDLFITTPLSLNQPLTEALEQSGRRFRVLESANVGRDVAPFLAALPVLIDEGYALACKLHTKQGTTGLGDYWRRLACEVLVGSSARVRKVQDTFRDEESLALLGPAELYKSARAFMYGNLEQTTRIIQSTYPDASVPKDWGFFAGTMFWLRPEQYAALAEAASKLEFEQSNSETDGQLAHAFERLFGVVPVLQRLSIGLVSRDPASPIEVVPAPGEPSRVATTQTLRQLMAGDGESEQRTVELDFARIFRNTNPLLHYIRHGERQGYRPNVIFDPPWYCEQNADVAHSGISPLRHFMTSGTRELRDPGPEFDTDYYLTQYPDVRRADMTPSEHYLLYGRHENRRTHPDFYTAEHDAAVRPKFGETPDWLRRFYETFDRKAEARYLADLSKRVSGHEQAVAGTLVTVIMPTFNRERLVVRAIDSVLRQTHQNFELLVVDDGSTDASRSVVESYARDPRIRLLELPHRGVSAARNAGLEAARGDLVAYLDSDNVWKPGYLKTIASEMLLSGLDCAYAGVELRDDRQGVMGYRGDRFSWAACLAENYVDLNVFCHRRSLLDEAGGFDERLRRLVDWDFILRCTVERKVDFAPFVGCEYHNAASDLERVTNKEPLLYYSVVQLRNSNRSSTPLPYPEVVKQLRLRIAIKIAARYEERREWGDFHFAESLKAAFEKLGHHVRIDFLGRWYDRSVRGDDVAIVLRGLTAYEPRRAHVNVMWNISHPDQVSYEEYDAYDLIYVASLSYPAFLRAVVPKWVEPLLQATDTDRFHPRADKVRSKDIVFVGNSRNEFRPMVRWAIEAGLEPSLYGTRWEQFVPRDLLKGEGISNRALSQVYGRAAIVLNDHWESMRQYGLVSNRIFDVLASGGRVISDEMPTIDRLFGPAVRQVRGAEELKQAVEELRDRPEAEADGCNLVRHVEQSHSFDRRAREILGGVNRFLGLPVPEEAGAKEPLGSPAVVRNRPLRVKAIVQRSAQHIQSSGFIRLACPLTSEAISGKVEFSILEDPDVDAAAESDVVIVQRTAIDREELADALVSRVRASGARLIVDNDDAFKLIDERHQEYELYREKANALRYLLGHADQGWFATAALEELYREDCGNLVIVPNALDPRIWKDYRRPRPSIPAKGHLRLLYMGTVTHDDDFALILPALDRLAGSTRDRFDVTVVGAVRQLPQRRWLKRLPVPAGMIAYPRFVRWLLKQEAFHVGLAPLADTPFNSCKSDLKFLDYCGLGLLPVLSDTRPYQGDAKQHGLAVLAENTAEGWHEALAPLLRNRETYADLAPACQDYLWRQRTTDDVARLQLRLLTQ